MMFEAAELRDISAGVAFAWLGGGSTDMKLIIRIGTSAESSVGSRLPEDMVALTRYSISSNRPFATESASGCVKVIRGLTTGFEQKLLTGRSKA